MIVALALALAIGVVSGLRVFTGPAVLYLLRGGIAGYVLSVVALGEYVADALPQIPPRTAIVPSVILRSASGAFTGWLVASGKGAPAIAGAVLGIAGALAGTYGGYSARMFLVKRIGTIPAAVLEDLVAIGLAVLILTR